MASITMRKLYSVYVSYSAGGARMYSTLEAIADFDTTAVMAAHLYLEERAKGKVVITDFRVEYVTWREIPEFTVEADNG